LRRFDLIEKIEPAGSVRRRKETVGDIDILATSKDAQAALEAFVRLPIVKEVLGKGTTKATIVSRDGIQVDLRIVDNRSFGTSLQYFTGSKEHNIKLRDLAKQKGFKLSEYNLEEIISGRRLYFESDDDVYRTLGLPPIPPEIREDAGEIEAAISGNLPVLIGKEDIKGDFHVHTDWSEGSNTIGEMVDAAKKLGYEYIAVTDHSRALGVAHGLSKERLLEQIEEIHKLNEKLHDFHVFTGIEVDIKADSSLDIPDNVLEQCDVVVAALHTGQKESRRQITSRLVTAMENKNVDILAHPTGRKIGEREGYDVDMDILFETAASTGTILEINANPARLDLSDINARKAKNRGVRLVICTDAHSTAHLGMMEFGVNVARRGWLEKGDVVNTKSVKQVKFKD
jgi:DNA polymerase (family 10)